MCLVFWGKPSLRRGAALSWQHAEALQPWRRCRWFRCVLPCCPLLLAGDTRCCVHTGHTNWSSVGGGNPGRCCCCFVVTVCSLFAFRGVMEKSFMEYYDFYEGVCKERLYLQGQTMQVGGRQFSC